MRRQSERLNDQAPETEKLADDERYIMTDMTFKLRQAHKDRQARMVDDYAEILETRDSSVMLWDSATLPYPKEDILMALLTRLHYAPDRAAADIYKAAALTLADYQNGVGEIPIRVPNAGDIAAGGNKSALKATATDLERLLALQGAVSRDFADIKGRSEVAWAFNKKITNVLSRTTFKLRRKLATITKRDGGR